MFQLWLGLRVFTAEGEFSPGWGMFPGHQITRLLEGSYTFAAPGPARALAARWVSAWGLARGTEETRARGVCVCVFELWQRSSLDRGG